MLVEDVDRLLHEFKVAPGLDQVLAVRIVLLFALAIGIGERLLELSLVLIARLHVQRQLLCRLAARLDHFVCLCLDYDAGAHESAPSPREADRKSVV